MREARQTKVCVVEPTSMLRRMVKDVLIQGARCTVVAVSEPPDLVSPRIAALNPQLVILGLGVDPHVNRERVKAVREKCANVPIVAMVTALDESDANQRELVSQGVQAFVARPPRSGHFLDAFTQWKQQLLAAVQRVLSTSKSALVTDLAGPSGSHPQLSIHHRFCPVVAIGASRKRMDSLVEILRALPEDFKSSLIIAHDLPATLADQMIARVTAAKSYPVLEAFSGARMSEGHVWLAPPKQHIFLRDINGSTRVALNTRRPVRFRRPSIDLLFQSVAEHYGAGAMGLLLAGCGHDGLRGCRALREWGGRVMVQVDRRVSELGEPNLSTWCNPHKEEQTLDEMVASVIRHTTKRTSEIVPTPGFKSNHQPRDAVSLAVGN